MRKGRSSFAAVRESLHVGFTKIVATTAVLSKPNVHAIFYSYDNQEIVYTKASLVLETGRGLGLGG